jgi:hypothetical protein
MAIPTVNEANGDFTHYAVIDFQDLQRSGFLSNLGAANQVKLASIPAGGGVVYCVAYERTAFAGATDITLDVGTTTGDPDEFIDGLDVDGMSAPVANTGDSFVQSAGNTTIAGGALPVSLVQTETDIIAEINGTHADLTAGELFIGLKILDPSKFVK